MSIIRRLSAESFVEEKQKETELVVYACLENFDYLDKLNSYRDIIQPQATLGHNQFCRCRKETRYKNGVALTDEPQYQFTVKTNGKKSKNLSKKTEYNFTVDQEFFDNFLNTAESKQIKKRYTFKLFNYEMTGTNADGQEQTIIIPEILYEVDVFYKENGYRSLWVKIDIELDDAFKFIEKNHPGFKDLQIVVSFKQLPFKLKQGFIEKQADVEQKKLLENLWEYEFREFINNKRR